MLNDVPIQVAPPANSERAKQPEGIRSVEYRLDGNRGTISVYAFAQPFDFDAPNDPAGDRTKFLQHWPKSIWKLEDDDLERRHVQIIDAPKLQLDDRFIVRSHERFVGDNGQVLDVTHFYRGVGIYLVCATSTAFTGDTGEAKAVHEEAASMLLSARLTR